MDEWDELLIQLGIEDVEIVVLPQSEPDFKFEYAHESVSESNTIFKNISSNID